MITFNIILFGYVMYVFCLLGLPSKHSKPDYHYHREISVGDPTILVDGKPVYMLLEGGTKQYMIPALPESDNGKHISFILTMFDGEADILLIDQNNHVMMNGSGDSKLTFQVRDDVTSLGPFYVNVTNSETVSTSVFSILCHFENSYIELYGIAQYYETKGNDDSFFTYDLDSPSFSIYVTPISGDPDVFVSTTTTRPSYGTCSYYTCWYLNSTSKFDYITIFNGSQPSPPFVLDETYYIGVHAYGIEISKYFVSVVNGDSNEPLISGQPLGGRVNANEYTFFKFSKEQQYTDLTILVESVKGDSSTGYPYLYVSKTNTKPDAENHDWESTHMDSKQSLTIEQGEVGVYYLSVFGLKYDVSFLISVDDSKNSTSIA